MNIQSLIPEDAVTVKCWIKGVHNYSKRGGCDAHFHAPISILGTGICSLLNSAYYFFSGTYDLASKILLSNREIEVSKVTEKFCSAGKSVLFAIASIVLAILGALAPKFIFSCFEAPKDKKSTAITPLKELNAQGKGRSSLTRETQKNSTASLDPPLRTAAIFHKGVLQGREGDLGEKEAEEPTNFDSQHNKGHHVIDMTLLQDDEDGQRVIDMPLGESGDTPSVGRTATLLKTGKGVFRGVGRALTSFWRRDNTGSEGLDKGFKSIV